MGKYVYIYYASDSTNAGDNEAWGAWFGKLGSKLIDPGNPFDDGAQVVHEGGVMPVKDMPATGYSIVKAASMKDAIELSKGCPLITLKSGAVAVYKALPM